MVNSYSYVLCINTLICTFLGVGGLFSGGE